MAKNEKIDKAYEMYKNGYKLIDISKKIKRPRKYNKNVEKST